LAEERIALLRKGVGSLIESRGIKGEEKDDLESCMELMATDENTTLPNILPEDTLEGLVAGGAGADDSDDSGEGEGDGDEADGSEEVDDRVRMMSGYAAEVDMHVAVLVAGDDSDDDEDNELSLQETIAKTWGFGKVKKIDMDDRNGDCVQVHWLERAKRGTWSLAWVKEEVKSTQPKKRRKRKAGSRYKRTQAKAKKQAHTDWVAATSIQCEIEFSKSRLTMKSLKELEFFVQKGQDVAQFDNHDDEFTALQAEMEAEE
jgi:hypothetical protein